MDKVLEDLGSFYLGKDIPLAGSETEQEQELSYHYDSKDLNTHAVILGMTGSGKTGLGVALLEEAALDGIPALIVDPKGDMGNLALSFPELKGQDFEAWTSSSEEAKKTAQLWAEGLEKSGQGSARLKKYKKSADVRIYTPGASHGIQLSILSFLKTPQLDNVKKPQEFLTYKASAAATSLCALLELEADPLNSPEHIYLTKIFHHYWKKSKDLNLELLVEAVGKPPFKKVGVISVQKFFSEKKQKELSMRINNLVAAPRFQNWIQGEPLDIQKLLWGEKGKTQLSVLSLGHLSDEERVFFVSLLLSELICWMRQQSGSQSLRALLYMDELFGYLPPTQNPPTKEPLLLLLKQARAFGLGLILSTQNPVDLDYKALSNIGTWFLGRLQTEQDKERVFEGLKKGLSSEQLKELKNSLSTLKKRHFVVRNVHEDNVSSFQVRWVLSYLKGPLDSEDIQALMDPFRPPEKTKSVKASSKSLNDEQELPPEDEIDQMYLPLKGRVENDLVYIPGALASANIFFEHKKSDLRTTVNTSYLWKAKGKAAPQWSKADAFQCSQEAFEGTKMQEARFAKCPENFFDEKYFVKLEKDFQQWLYQNYSLEIFFEPQSKTYSQLGETEEAFRGRLSHSLREIRDEEVEALKKKFAKEEAKLQKKMQRLQNRLDRETQQASDAKKSALIGFGTALITSFLGRKKVSVGNLSRGASALRRGSRAMKEGRDIARVEAQIQDLQDEFQDLEDQLQDEITDLKDDLKASKLRLEKIRVAPLKKNIEVKNVALAWMPHARVSEFELEPVWGRP